MSRSIIARVAGRTPRHRVKASAAAVKPSGGASISATDSRRFRNVAQVTNSRPIVNPNGFACPQSRMALPGSRQPV